MDFTDIYKKIKSIDEGQGVMAPPSGPEMPVEECGIEVMSPHAPEQQDNVTMNVSMTGNGSGGIRDLMSILRNLEDEGGEDNVITSEPAKDIDVMLGDMEEEYGNSAPGASKQQTASIQDVTNVGTTTNGGDHTRNRQAGLPQAKAHPMHEDVVDRLQDLYTRVKRRDLHEGCLEDPHKHALAHILMADRHGHNQLIKTGIASPDLYENLYDYYWDDMPREIKKHPDHKVRHNHVVDRCKVDMMTPECVQAMSGSTIEAPQPTLEQYNAIKQEGAFTDIADTKIGDVTPRQIGQGIVSGANKITNRVVDKLKNTNIGSKLPTPTFPSGTFPSGKLPPDQNTPVPDDDGRSTVTSFSSDADPKYRYKPQATQGDARKEDDFQARVAASADSMRESTDLSRIKELNKILNG